jgi:hypothetical protein
VRTNESQENIVALSDIREKKLPVLSPFGPVRADSTTWRVREIHRAYQEARLMELLSSLESEVATLESKYCTALDTLSTAIQGARAALSGIATDNRGTD